jgi:2-amino-4-hydroxy-6-hydroxymethyldihydropteridine diphosphokinase
VTNYSHIAFIGIGANLPSLGCYTPRATCEAAIKALVLAGISIESQSSWFKSAPVPASAQPWFINGVVSIEISLEAPALIGVLQDIESKFGRTRTTKNAARTLDLDLIAYADYVSGWEQGADDKLILPHPRMHERKFVLLPLHEIAPDWCHPIFQTPIKKLISKLDPKQQVLLDNTIP